jgi:hypothetical protein
MSVIKIKDHSFFISEDVVSGLKAWLYYSILTGLCQTRSQHEAQEICDVYFQNLKHRFSGWKSIEVDVLNVLFQKL